MKIKVMLVDDDEDILNVFWENLANSNEISVVGTARDGKDAIKLYNMVDPDVVIMDLKMPEYDGIYGMANIRKINPNAKIIMITGATTNEASAKLAAHQPSAIIYKPYEISQMVGMIQKVMNVQTTITN